MKFKCVYTPGGSRRLSIGKIYDVSIIKNKGTVDEKITIVDNVGDEATYYIIGADSIIWFIDAIEEIREEKLNKILNKKDP